MSRPPGQSLAAWLGLATMSDQPAYGTDERFGVTSQSRLAESWVRTTCGYCSVGCGMFVGVSQGRAVAVRGDPDHPVNRGRLCPKGLSEHHTLSGPGRLVTPLVGAGGGQPQLRASWDQAIGALVDGFGVLVAEHGPDSVAILSTGQLVTEELYALGKLARLGLGVRHYDGNTTLCMASAVSGYKASFGSDGPPGCYDDLESADCILLVGANIADNHPLLAPRVLANGDATLIVVDPRVTKTAMVADLHLAVRPRTDIVLLNAMAKVIIDEGLVDAAYVAAHTEGYAELAAHLDGLDVAAAAQTCGIGEDQLRAAALAWGRARAGFAAWTMGVNHSVQGTETVTLVNNLCLLTGNLGRPGAAPFSITGQCNAMGSREASGTASLPGYRRFDCPGDREELARHWGVAASRIPSQRGRAYPDIIDGMAEGTIRGLWVIGTNPPVSFPNRARLESALAGLDLLVVQDGYETPTTRLAHVVLPAAVWGEKEGTYTNSERRVCRVRAAVEPVGEARADLAVFMAVARRAGVDQELFAGWHGPQDAFDEWARISAGRLCDYSAMTYEGLEAAGGIQWPCPAGGAGGGPGGAAGPGGGARLYADGAFPTPSGRARLCIVSPRPLTEPPTAELPWLLNTGRTVEHWHTRTKTGRVGILEEMAPEAWVELNPADAAGLGLSTGDRARLVSARGCLEDIAVWVTGIVRPGEVFVPFHYDETCVNRLTLDEFDPVSREPNYKQCAVRVERAR